MRGSTSCSPFRCRAAAYRVSLLLIFCQCHLITQYTLDSGLVNLYFYTLREPNNYIKRASLFFSSFIVVRPTQFFGIITKKKGEKERKRKRQGLIFLTLINSFNWKMSIITTFPGIRGSVVYPFFYEIDHYFFCHIEFVSIWWLSCWERHAYLLARLSLIAPYFQAPAQTQLCLVVFKLHQREPTFLLVNCTWKLRASFCNIENPATVSKFSLSSYFAQIKPLVSYFRKYN